MNWVELLGADPRPWIASSAEPSARLLCLAELTAPSSADAARLSAAKAAVLADPGMADLIDRLPDWERDPTVAGHNSPSFAPNLLGMFWWMGLRGGDSARVERLLDQMLSHQDAEGRFRALGRRRGELQPGWGALLCDTHAIADILVRFGRAGDRRTAAAIERIIADLTTTTHGMAWPCRPDDATGFRGPGRKGDPCPQVTAEALRVLALHARDRGIQAPLPEFGEAADAAAAALCSVWHGRGSAQPYMFGHGRRFKRVKWPPMWYDAFTVLDALSLWPRAWDSRPENEAKRQAVCELAACLVAYNFGPDGLVTPRSCYRGFEDYSWGQKKQPSPLATAMACVILRRLEPLVPQIAAVDVRKLGSSRGGTGVPLPPD